MTTSVILSNQLPKATETEADGTERRVSQPELPQAVVVIDTTSFRCSKCGCEIDVQIGVRLHSEHLASEKKAESRRERIRRAKFLPIALALGVMLHGIGDWSSAFRYCSCVAYLQQVARSAIDEASENTDSLPSAICPRQHSWGLDLPADGTLSRHDL